MENSNGLKTFLIIGILLMFSGSSCGPAGCGPMGCIPGCGIIGCGHGHHGPRVGFWGRRGPRVGGGFFRGGFRGRAGGGRMGGK